MSEVEELITRLAQHKLDLGTAEMRIAELERELASAEKAIAGLGQRLLYEHLRTCNGSCDIALARRQIGPDGYVPGNARECAEMWEREASRLQNLLRDTQILLDEKNQTADVFMKQIRALQKDNAALRGKLGIDEVGQIGRE
jgi:hypothetical protein